MAGGADDAEDDDDERPSAEFQRFAADAWGTIPEFLACPIFGGGFFGAAFKKGPRGPGYDRDEPSKHAWYQQL